MDAALREAVFRGPRLMAEVGGLRLGGESEEAAERPQEDRAHGLFCLFVAAGTKVGYEVVGLGFFEDVGEGGHLFTAVVDLGSDLGFVEPAAYAGEIGAFGASMLADSVALKAAGFCEDLGSPDAWVC